MLTAFRPRVTRSSTQPFNNQVWSRTILIALLSKSEPYDFSNSASVKLYYSRLVPQKRKNKQHWHLEGRCLKVNTCTSVCYFHPACWSDTPNSQNDSLPVTMMTELGKPHLGLLNHTNNTDTDIKSRGATSSTAEDHQSPQPQQSSSECTALDKVRNDSRATQSKLPARPGRPSIGNYKGTLEKLKRLGVLKKRQVNSFVGMTSPSSHLPHKQPHPTAMIKKKLSPPSRTTKVQPQCRNKIMESTLAYKLEEYYKAREKDDLSPQTKSGCDMKPIWPPAYPCTSPSKSRYKNVFCK